MKTTKISTTRLAIAAIIASTICGSIWIQLASNSDEHVFCKEAKLQASPDTQQFDPNRLNSVVFAKNDVHKGTLIQASDFEERKLAEIKTPPDALRTLSVMPGRIAKREIKADRIVVMDDVTPILPLDEQ